MYQKLRFSLIVSLIFLVSPNFAQTTMPEEAFAGLQYRSIGPSRGGRVTAVTGVAADLFTYYMGATGGGVWKTTDAGLSWKNISDGYVKAGSIGAITVAPSDPNILYLGTGSADPRGNVSPGVGLYKSTNAGQSWSFIGLPDAGQISKIVVHPSNPDLVYVAILGNVFGPSQTRGIYRSKDGGQNWEQVHFVSDKTGAIDLVMDPNNPRTLYAGMWTAERKPWTFIDGSDEGGVYKSTDSGDTWSKVKAGLPSGVLGRIGLAISPANGDRVWAFVEAQEETKGGLYRSDNGGKSFQRINRNHKLRQRAWYYSRVIADPQNENTVYFMNVSAHRSIDGGKTFVRIPTPHGDNHALWINPDNTKVMVQGNDGGANVTFNGGQTWTTQLNQTTAEFYRVSVDNQFPYRVYGAQQDNSTISVPSRFQGRIGPQAQWYTVGGGESGHIAIDPRDPNLIYAGTYIGQITRLERNRGHRKDVVAYPQMHDGTAPRDIKYRFQWNAPIRISPHNPDVVYHCSQYVHRTSDGGRTWEVISPDLTTDKDEYHDIPGEPVQHDHTGVELYTTIFAFEESPKNPGELWAGSDDGRLHISRDNGDSWQEITPKDIPVEGTINNIDLSAHQDGRALISVYKYRENDFKPYIFLTNNYGKNWTLLTDGKNGIPEDHFVRVVREDPIRQGLLYAGTEFGMYISFDEGKNWQSFQRNLPIVPITDMLIKDNDLVLSTQGRSFWIVDDLSPLREMSEELIAEKGYLFPINTAYRSQLNNYRGIAAPDPAPNGALIYYYNNGESKDIQLKIFDPNGEERVSYSTTPDSKKKEKTIRPQKGLNRLQWNMRYEGPVVQQGARFSLANLSGIKAIPGTHKVQLIVDGQMMEQTLDIAPDPRWSQTPADLKAQHDLTYSIKALLNDCHASIGELRALRKQIKDQQKKLESYDLQNKDFDKEAKRIIENLNNLEETLIQTKSESGQDPINYPPMLDDQIAYLYSVVNAQDDRPTQGAQQRYDDLKAEFAKHKEVLTSLQKDDIPTLNTLLGTTGLQMIQTGKEK